MPSLINGVEWAAFKQSQANIWDTFGLRTMTWVRRTKNVGRFNEGDFTSTTETLRFIAHHNILRTWPIDYNTESGELDRQTVQVYIFKQYLADLGFIDGNGKFIYNRDIDRFIIDGETYEPEGDTPAAQAGIEDLWFTMVLKRDNKPTSG